MLRQFGAWPGFLSAMLLSGVLSAERLPTRVSAQAPEHSRESEDSSSPEQIEAFAQQHFERGRQFYRAGSYSQALESFQRSYGLVASPNSQLYAARCLRELGRLNAALHAYGVAIREARRRALSEPRFTPTQDAAETEMRALEARVGHVVLNGSPPEGAQVLVAGQRVPPEALGLPWAVTPGEVEVELRNGGASAHHRLMVSAGSERSLNLEWPSETPAGGVEEPQMQVPTSAPSHSGRAWAPVSVATGAVAAAGLAMFVGFAVPAASRFDELHDMCGGAPCPAAQTAAIADGERFQLVANIGLGVGIAAAAVSLAFLVAHLISN